MVGRSGQCEIVIDEFSISRTHAVLSISPTSLSIKDLASANGTRVRDHQIEPNRAVEIRPGEPIQIGNVTVIVQRRAPQLRPRRLWTHDYFEVRLEEECARAARRG